MSQGQPMGRAQQFPGGPRASAPSWSGNQQPWGGTASAMPFQASTPGYSPLGAESSNGSAAPFAGGFGEGFSANTFSASPFSPDKMDTYVPPPPGPQAPPQTFDRPSRMGAPMTAGGSLFGHTPNTPPNAPPNAPPTPSGQGSPLRGMPGFAALGGLPMTSPGAAGPSSHGPGPGPQGPAPSTPFQPGQVGWEFDTSGSGWIPQMNSGAVNYWGDMRHYAPPGFNPDRNNWISSVQSWAPQSYDQWSQGHGLGYVNPYSR